MSDRTQTAGHPLAFGVMNGIYQVTVVHEDGCTETFPGFFTAKEAKSWAVKNRTSLGLGRCASWSVNGRMPDWRLAWVYRETRKPIRAILRMIGND